MDGMKKAAEAAKRESARNRKPDYNLYGRLRYTKVENQNGFYKLLLHFRYNTGTTLDAMIATGVLRNSITYYVAEAERMGLLQVVFKARDRRTGRLAKHYSSDPDKWRKHQSKQLTLWEGMI